MQAERIAASAAVLAIHINNIGRKNDFMCGEK